MESCSKISGKVYLDNNATTLMPVSAVKAMVEWTNRGNPSADYEAAKLAKKMLSSFKNYLLQLCQLNIESQGYQVIFTSGASEANCMLIGAVVCSYRENMGKSPHMVVSSIEHKSILALVESYVDRGLLAVTYVKPMTSGHISPESVERAITAETALVVIMHANNETGALNDIASIGAKAHEKGIPFHSDTAQTFGKVLIKPVEFALDSFCVSFHKLHGPPGVGALIVKREFMEGYKLCPLIFGTQNDGRRGGTENLPGLGGAFAGLRWTETDRRAKNAKTSALKERLVLGLQKLRPVAVFEEYVTRTRVKKKPIEIVILSMSMGRYKGKYLPGTLLLSIVKNALPPVCNGKVKRDLETAGYIVSIGSACNTASTKASHVLGAMGADALIRAGTLRISIGDENTECEIDGFVAALHKIINAL